MQEVLGRVNIGFAALALPFAGSDYAISFSIQLLIFLILAYSWNLIGGYAAWADAQTMELERPSQ